MVSQVKQNIVITNEEEKEYVDPAVQRVRDMLAELDANIDKFKSKMDQVNASFGNYLTRNPAVANQLQAQMQNMADQENSQKSVAKRGGQSQVKKATASNNRSASKKRWSNLNYMPNELTYDFF